MARERQGVSDRAAKDAKLPPLATRSAGYPLLSEGRRFKGEESPQPVTAGDDHVEPSTVNGEVI